MEAISNFIGMLIEKIKMYLKKRNDEKLLKESGFICYCPNCGRTLNRSSPAEDISECVVAYKCSYCECKSFWMFCAPVPILLSDYVTEIKK